MGIMEHVEPAGIHSGDSSAVLPPYSLSQSAIDQMVEYARKIAFALKIKGLINIQFAIRTARGSQEEKVFVIEANPRASRTTPFIAKAYKIPYLNIATKVMLGTHKLKDFTFEKKLEGYAIKVPVFSFEKFPNVDKRLGPEMKSTGEAIQFIDGLTVPFFRGLDRNRNMQLFECTLLFHYTFVCCTLFIVLVYSKIGGSLLPFVISFTNPMFLRSWSIIFY